MLTLLAESSVFLTNLREISVPAGAATDTINVTIKAKAMNGAFCGCKLVANSDHANALELGECALDESGGTWTAQIKALGSGGLDITGHGKSDAESGFDGDVTPKTSHAGDMATGFPLQLEYAGVVFVDSCIVTRG